MNDSKLYVGNLSYSVTGQQLETLFSQHGQVKGVTVVEGKGFGFVEMASPAEADAAKSALDGTDFEGRTLKVDKARPPKPRTGGPRGGGGSGPRRGGGGGGGGFGGGGYRRY